MKNLTLMSLSILFALTISSCGGGAVSEEDASEAGETLQKWGQQIKEEAEKAADK